MNKKFTILNYFVMVTGPAYGNQRSSSAFQFVNALLKRGHNLKIIFFYQDGVLNANRLVSPASDEINLVNSWCNLAKKYKLELHVCNSAALRRGIVNSIQSDTFNLSGENFKSYFKLSSLNKFAKSILNCDRFIQF